MQEPPEAREAGQTGNGATASPGIEEVQRPPDSVSPSGLTRLAVVLESLLLLIALLTSWFGWYDQSRPLASWLSGPWLGQVLAGALLALPLLWLVLVALPAIPAIRSAFESIEQMVGPLFQGMPVWQIWVISLSAGIGEEVFFRWALQGTLTQWMPLPVAVLIASLAFGACHCLNATYFVVTACLGVILSMIYLLAGPLAAVACHATYDYLAIRHLVKNS
jgi:membrane protease YdiL (CAAX protease family)